MLKTVMISPLVHLSSPVLSKFINVTIERELSLDPQILIGGVWCREMPSAVMGI